MASSKSTPTSSAATMQDMLQLVAKRKQAPAPEPEPIIQPAAEPAVASEATTLSPTPAPAVEPEPPREPVKQTEKKEPAAEQNSRPNYAETFLVSVRDRKTKAVYITEEAHRTIAAIAQASDGTSLADVLGNIIIQHFKTHGSDIRAFLTEQEKKNKKGLLI